MNPNIERFVTEHDRDGQTDGQTDWQQHKQRLRTVPRGTN